MAGRLMGNGDLTEVRLTVKLPSVRKQHNAGYKHKANVRTYYEEYEAQQNQYLIDLKVKEHLGQAAAFQQVGAAYNQLMPCVPVPMMPMPWNPMMPIPGMRPLAPLPRPILGYPGMPPMVAPHGAPSMPGQVNPNMPVQVNPNMPGQVNPFIPGQGNPSISGQINNGVPRPLTVSAPMMASGSSGTPTSGTPPPMFAPTMYQSNPSASGSNLDSNAKMWRLVADLMNDLVKGLTTLNQLMIVTGSFISFLLGTVVSMRTLALTRLIPCVLLLVGLLFIPESPRWLAKVGREVEFENSLRRLRGAKANIYAEANEIHVSPEHSIVEYEDPEGMSTQDFLGDT
ncbi:hypothetical protein M8C21_026148 [Ambrosia artemisiifolia]|uniref:U1-C C2H2-type zinc finger domain-containing protein n=1 Tax=Ambrosia artemisiifolia TaxID=4212 RepID=A0AAD5CQ49_AMBAR|nr:hypothetical protein M8C21_026148 [Ambrosia artemisiifolia]